jgi:hypothetical protein
LSLRGHYQNAYVTHDLDRAIELVGPSLGLGEFSQFDVEMPLKTSAGDRTAILRVGTAWAGGLQIELIQPVAGFVDHYSSALPQDPNDIVPRWHHVAVRRETPEEMQCDIELSGFPVVFTSESAGISCALVDARKRLGHYLEFVSATPDGWNLLGWPDSK